MLTDTNNVKRYEIGGAKLKTTVQEVENKVNYTQSLKKIVIIGLRVLHGTGRSSSGRVNQDKKDLCDFLVPLLLQFSSCICAISNSATKNNLLKLKNNLLNS